MKVGSVHVPMLYRSIILPSFARCQANAVELATKFFNSVHIHVGILQFFCAHLLFPPGFSTMTSVVEGLE